MAEMAGRYRRLMQEQTEEIPLLGLSRRMAVVAGGTRLQVAQERLVEMAAQAVAAVVGLCPRA